MLSWLEVGFITDLKSHKQDILQKHFRLIDLCILQDACHEFFCIFEDFYASGMHDAGVTKSLHILWPKAHNWSNFREDLFKLFLWCFIRNISNCGNKKIQTSHTIFSQINPGVAISSLNNPHLHIYLWMRSGIYLNLTLWDWFSNANQQVNRSCGQGKI